jgi:hypothetical protein
LTYKFSLMYCDPVNFYLSFLLVYGLVSVLFFLHVLDYILDRVSGLFRLNNYLLGEKAYTVMLHVAGLSFRDLSARYLYSYGFLGEC